MLKSSDIEVVKEFTFDSAHCLPAHKGKCKNVHGHTYRLQVGFKGPVDPKTGMVVDFGDVKEAVKGLIVDKIDHAMLNEVDCPGFPKETPTAENMVEWMVDVLRMGNPPNPLLSFVRLYETPTSYAEWRE